MLGRRGRHARLHGRDGHGNAIVQLSGGEQGLRGQRGVFVCATGDHYQHGREGDANNGTTASWQGRPLVTAGRFFLVQL